MNKIHEDLHRLVDLLPDQQASLAKRLLEALMDETDEDTEPLSPEEQTALERGKAQAARGETVSWKAVKEELKRDV